MSRLARLPRFIWRLAHFLPPRLAYMLGLGSLVGGSILILRTTGRKTGRSRATPLLYDEIDGIYYVATARGRQADWYRNVLADPQVEVEVGAERLSARGEPITDPDRVLQFLEERMRRRPRVTGLILRLAGLGPAPTSAQLAEYASDRGLIAVHRTEGTGRNAPAAHEGDTEERSSEGI